MSLLAAVMLGGLCRAGLYLRHAWPTLQQHRGQTVLLCCGQLARKRHSSTTGGLVHWHCPGTAGCLCERRCRVLA